MRALRLVRNIKARSLPKRFVRAFSSPDANNMMPEDIGNHPAVFGYRDCVWSSTGFGNPQHVLYCISMYVATFVVLSYSIYTPNDVWIKTGINFFFFSLLC
jgi:hypothetical protein